MSNRIRIGTWNMDGGWGPAYESVLAELNCDLLLLTEVGADAHFDGFQRHVTSALMPHRTKRKHWAGIFARAPLEPMPDPHPASAVARTCGITVCSSVLPWLPATDLWPWEPVDHTGRVQTTVDELKPTIHQSPVIWGGDWNQPLTGAIRGFSQAAQDILNGALEESDLQVPTAALGGMSGQASIDHVAVPSAWTVIGTKRVPAPGVSGPDHEAAYWVDVMLPSS